MEHDPLVAPIYITSRNAESVLGIPWDSVRSIAERFGVKPLQGVYAKRHLYRASDLVRAIERAAAQDAQEMSDFERQLRATGVIIDRS